MDVGSFLGRWYQEVSEWGEWNREGRRATEICWANTAVCNGSSLLLEVLWGTVWNTSRNFSSKKEDWDSYPLTPKPHRLKVAPGAINSHTSQLTASCLGRSSESGKLGSSGRLWDAACRHVRALPTAAVAETRVCVCVHAEWSDTREKEVLPQLLSL